MIDRENFDFIKKKHGYCASWAIWSEENEKPKSNIGDLTILDPEINKKLLSQLNPNIVLVGLNISQRIQLPLANFHAKRPGGTDFKIRFAFRGSPYWGGYMTDIIKDYEQKILGKMAAFLRKNKPFEEEQIKFFRQELEDLGTQNPTVIALGNETFNILNRNFKDELKILKVPHYAHYINKEKCREQVKAIW